MAAHPVSPPPFRFDPPPPWLADDFFVAAANDWQTVRASLLAAVEQTGRKSGAERLVMVSARTDEPKRAMLAELGYQRGASWWVHPIQAFEGERTTLRDTDAVVGPAPRSMTPAVWPRSPLRCAIPPMSRPLIARPLPRTRFSRSSLLGVPNPHLRTLLQAEDTNQPQTGSSRTSRRHRLIKPEIVA
jgi:hypothetical protein